MTTYSPSGSLDSSDSRSKSAQTVTSSDSAKNLGEALCQAALVMGFDAAGICAAELDDDDKNAWLSYLKAGHQAGMDYLEKTREPRAAGARALLPGAQSVLVVARSYHQPQLDKKRPVIARYALGKDYHKTLRADLARLMKHARSSLRLAGDYRLCVDTAPLLERAYARKAGLGWIGRSGMLVSQQLGSYTLLGAVLLGEKLPVRSAFSQQSLIGCGSCRACVTSCPTQAISASEVKDHATDKINAPGHVDAGRCISYWTIEHRGAFDDVTPDYDRWIFGCDRCQEVCPLNHKARAGSDPRLQARATVLDLQAEQILQKDDDLIRSKIAGTPVKRAGLTGLRRNARRLLQAGSAKTIRDELDKHTNNK